MLAMTLFAVASASKAPISKVLTLRGGIDLGPITSSNVDGILKVAGAVTAAGAITEKYADISETTLTKTFKGDVNSSQRQIEPRVPPPSLNLLIGPGHTDHLASNYVAPFRCGRPT